MGRVSPLRSFADTVLAPHADTMDVDPERLAEAWRAFVADGLTPFHLFDDIAALAEASGAFAFLALQRCVAGPDAPSAHAGVAFGHLRNPSGPAPLWDDGRVRGRVPWMSGAGIFDTVLLGFRLPDGAEVRAWVEATDRPGFRHGPVRPLIACASTQTVAVDVDLPIPESEFVSVAPLGTLAEGDAAGLVGHTPLLLGNVRASVLRIGEAGRGDADAARRALENLEARIAAARAGEADGGPVRARAADLAVRTALLACLADGGGALDPAHPSSRLYREALVFSLMAQTDQVVDDAFREILGG